MANMPPGPLGQTPLAVDSGTLVQTKSDPPSPTGMGDDATSALARAPSVCTGREITFIVGLGPIGAYKGDFPSPLPVMWYAPKLNEILKLRFSPSEIRGWIKNAAAYHGIPHVLLALILQQENGPRATDFQKVGQFGERTVTTLFAIADDYLFDVVPDKISGGSSGFANMSRATLRHAAKYTENMYGKNPLPASVRFRAFGWDQDTRVPGDDWHADLYYCAAHLRQLIDRVTGKPCHDGALTLGQLEAVIAAYNGSGPLAAKYARDAMKTLQDASAGTASLYFYEP